MNNLDESGFWLKMRSKDRSPLKVVPRNALIGSIGGFIAIALLALLTDLTANAWIMAPFGATCVLAFGLWDAPLSQPRNIIGGHLISTLVGLLFFHLFGRSVWVIAIAVGLAIGLMMLTKTTHPPAGADPLVVILSGSSWSFLFAPVLIGSVLIVIIALIINNLDKKRRYPTFWY
ncbi:MULTISPECIES: HPP family protein [Paenibacillus]|uniref:HPP family protein n=1 Tax=Paenibacillus violae TaxID=3077234 RepID=A0ABU3RIB8_9BACL|nr:MULTISPECIES: HPP family protein [Paenibacillus]MDU0203562.1 HPP family protein [Paenibacillus sp. PFR10]MEC0267343.1 HPP family protein [Paenibacillus anseongense]